MRLTRQLTAFALACACLTACGGGGGYSTSPSNTPPGDQPPPTGTNLTVQNNRFSPTALSVNAGQTVTWTWDTCSNDPYGGGSACVSHDILFDDGATSDAQSSGTYSRTFANKGTYPYHCSIHGTAMSGSITVK